MVLNMKMEHGLVSGVLMDELLNRMMEAHRFWTTIKGDEVVPIQQDFPNCKAKGNGCCYDAREFWDELQRKFIKAKTKYGQIRTDLDVTSQTFIGSPSSIALGEIFKTGERSPQGFGTKMPKVRF